MFKSHLKNRTRLLAALVHRSARCVVVEVVVVVVAVVVVVLVVVVFVVLVFFLKYIYV